MTTSLDKGQRLIFVGGAPRSGTTLVQNILDSHPDICGSPEFIHIPDIVDLKNKLQYSANCGYIDLICSSNDVDRSIRSLIEDLLLPLADKNGCKFLSEKTPENVLVFSEIIDLFPEARFIHVIRDPRATVSSLLEVGTRRRNKGLKPPKHTADIASAVRHTKECLTRGFSASKLAPESFLSVVYERLITEPEHETMKICEFLGIEWSSNMINPGKFTHPGEEAITAKSDETWYNSQTYNRNPDTRSLDKWKTSLTPTQRVAITTSFKDDQDLNQLGYCFSDSDMPFVKRFLEFSIDNVSFIKHFFGVIYYTYTRLTSKVLYKIASTKVAVLRQFSEP